MSENQPTTKLSLFDRLKKLFNSSIIYRPLGSNKIKVVDPNRLQSSGGKNNTRMQDKFGRLYASNYGGFGGLPGNDQSTQVTKMELYTDYEIMDTDAIISSVLDIVADECVTKNERGDILRINSPDEEIKEHLENLFYDILDIEFNLWPWIRGMCKYGDMYLGLDVREKYGITGVVPLSNYFMQRIEGTDEDPHETKFQMVDFTGMGNSSYGNATTYAKDQEATEFEQFEIAHFRLIADNNFLPYGKSYLEGGRKLYKQITLMEDSMLLHRIMRAPEKRLFKIDVGGLSPDEIAPYMENVMNKIKKAPFIDPDTGQYNLRFNIQNMTEDFFMPVRGSEVNNGIESVNGLQYDMIDDIDYLKGKMFAAFKVPKAFIGYEEGIDGTSVLTQQDIRFARTIERLQKMVVNELTKMAIVHLYAKGIESQRLVDFTLNLTIPSIIAEQEKLSLFSEKVRLASDMKDLKMVSRDFIYKNVFGFSDKETKDEADKALQDIKTIFRESQIENEGNDPAVTKESYGTPHDIASMHTSKKFDSGDSLGFSNGGSEPGGQPGAGRPYHTVKYGSSEHPSGPDPLGRKNIKKVFTYDDAINQHFKQSGIKDKVSKEGTESQEQEIITEEQKPLPTSVARKRKRIFEQLDKLEQFKTKDKMIKARSMNNKANAIIQTYRSSLTEPLRQDESVDINDIEMQEQSLMEEFIEDTFLGES